MTDYSLYVITDEKISCGKTHLQLAKEAIRGGATVIQLRDKTKNDNELYGIAEELAEYCWGCGVMFIVNDRVDIALMSAAAGVHLGQTDIPVSAVREFAPHDFIIGVSVSTVEEALKAQNDGADYLALSPLFDTSSKDDAGRGLGLKRMKEIKEAVFLPVIAIGGISSDNVSEVITAGADGVAVISAVAAQKDACAAAADLKKKIIEARGCW